MKYWDSSALLPLLVEEPHSASLRSLAKSDAAIVTWWGTPVELYSAMSRRHREGHFSDAQLRELRQRFTIMLSGLDIVSPHIALRDRAIRLLGVHTLRAADILQLAAALRWSQEQPLLVDFVCLDERLRLAARGEGFQLLP